VTLPGESPVPQPLDASLYARLDALYQRQLRAAAGEVAAAIAHAAGTPLNVISGRSELIRQDPVNAAAQLTRIDDQVRKLAEGLRQFVEYLTLQSGAPQEADGKGELPAAQLLSELSSLIGPLAVGQRVTLSVDPTEIGSASVDAQILSNLVALVSWAVSAAGASNGSPNKKVELKGSATPGGVLFELTIPGLPPPDAWRIERFEANAPGETSEPYRVMAICAAVARGQGGKLFADALPDGSGVKIRLTYRSGP
jgi:signal transduction histidine kinase